MSTPGGIIHDVLQTDRVASPPHFAHLYGEKLAYFPYSLFLNDHRQSFGNLLAATNSYSKSQVLGVSEDTFVFAYVAANSFVDPLCLRVCLFLDHFCSLCCWFVIFEFVDVVAVGRCSCFNKLSKLDAVTFDAWMRIHSVYRIRCCGCFGSHQRRNKHTPCCWR